MIFSFSSYPSVAPRNNFSTVSFFIIRKGAGRFPNILLGFGHFYSERFERKRTPFFTGPILILFVLAMLCCASVGID